MPATAALWFFEQAMTGLPAYMLCLPVVLAACSTKLFRFTTSDARVRRRWLQVADAITELKLGNGTSILIFANIASALPTSVGAALTQATDKDASTLGVYALAWFLTTLGIVYVQEAERQIPITYASRYRAGALQQQAYLPFKVNATGVMPIIFSSSLLALPSSLARYANLPAFESAAAALSPSGALYLPANVALIVAFNYLYTFLQLDPKDLSEQLKRQGASIPGVRPGRATAEYITKTLDRMSVLGKRNAGDSGRPAAAGTLDVLAQLPPLSPQKLTGALSKLSAFCPACHAPPPPPSRFRLPGCAGCCPRAGGEPDRPAGVPWVCGHISVDPGGRGHGHRSALPLRACDAEVQGWHRGRGRACRGAHASTATGYLPRHVRFVVVDFTETSCHTVSLSTGY
jgi:hypothetical protein